MVGPTATGKSELAIGIAHALGAAEIVNADAMQLYRGMDIGTAKVPPAERGGVAHHQLDVLVPSQDAAVAAYQRHARADLRAIRERGATPVVVGGSGLYVRALLDELEFPGTDPAIRARLEERLAAEGPGALADELARRDPVAAGNIHPRNSRRLVRALEVIELTGRPFSASLPAGRFHEPTVQLGIRLPLEQLDERIDARAARMVTDGLVAEAAGLGALSRTAARATGYAQALAHLRGELSEEEMVAEIALATRQLARRQVKWFRRDSRIVWLQAGTDLVPRALAALSGAGGLPPG